ncbi:MAG TPA: DUF2231 domain-containing protein [Actinomycetota bacterium]|nr:DUF2231 domain-containing protein [Actinomycetota bacterium]
MAIMLRYRAPTGETRPWTLREILQGKPIDRPTHPMLVHFPIAFYIGVLVLDVLSRIGSFPAAPLAATWLIIGSLAGFAGAALTGLAERSTMRHESRIHTLATRHMLLQYTAAAIFVVDFAIRWSHRHDVHASLLWIALDLIGVLVMTVASDIGGQMVFKIGYRGLGGD